MDTGSIVAIVGEVITVLCLLGGGVWATAKMQSSISSLTHEIKSLTRAVSELDVRLDNHHDRLLRLEVHNELDDVTLPVTDN